MGCVTVRHSVVISFLVPKGVVGRGEGGEREGEEEQEGEEIGRRGEGRVKN